MNVINFKGERQATPLQLPEDFAKISSDLIANSAEGSPCTLRISSYVKGGQCSGSRSTVACSLPSIGNISGSDLACAYACASCSSILHGPDPSVRDYLFEHHGAAIFEKLLNGIIETHTLLFQKGIILVPDARVLT